METSVSPRLQTEGIQAEGLEGIEIDGKYRVDACLAEGNRQTVWETSSQNRLAVIKVISPETAEEASALLAGFRAGQKLRHPHLLEVYDFGETTVRGTPCVYVVTERPDENLAGVLRERALDQTETRQILDGIFPALEFLHDQGYVHGGLRPSEVLACGDTVKISADGIKLFSAGKPFSANPGLYGAPEIADGIFGPSSDAWSAAVLTLESLTLSPYRSETDRLSSPFREIVEGGLERDPANRWQVSRMREALAGGAADLPGLAPRKHQPLEPKYRRFGGLAIGGALAAAAICALLIRSAHQTPAPPPVTIQAPPPAVTSPIPAKPQGDSALNAIPAGWAVVGAAYRRQNDAEQRAAEMRKTHAKLNPRIFSAGERFLVVFGSGLTEVQAKRQLDRSRRAGAPRDSYLTKFR
jgi:serine/threonine protein kinase